MNKDELTALAKEKGVQVTEEMTKADIQAAIDAKDAEDEAASETSGGDIIPPSDAPADGRPGLDAPLKGEPEDADAARAEKMGCVDFEDATEAYTKEGKTIRRLAWLDGRCVDPKHGGQNYQPTEADQAATDWIIV